MQTERAAHTALDVSRLQRGALEPCKQWRESRLPARDHMKVRDSGRVHGALCKMFHGPGSKSGCSNWLTVSDHHTQHTTCDINLINK